MNKHLKVIEKKARYAATVEREFAKSVNLLPNEKIELKKRVIVYSSSFNRQNPGLIALTNKRIIFLIHHLLGADKLLYIPLSSISKVNLNAQGISIKYEDESINFMITYIQKFMTTLIGPKKTDGFFELLKEKLPKGIVETPKSVVE